MTVAWASLALALAVVPPQGSEEILRIERGTDSARVSANRPGVPCDVALAELAEGMDWQLRFHPESLRGQLAEQVVDLAFEGEQPRTLAQLITVAAGADAVFHASEEGGTRRVDVTVVAPADASSDAGRDRLREQALTWYRAWLAERIARGETDDDDSVRVRWHVAELLRGAGDMEEAARLYATLCSDDEHELVPAARLRLATTLFELGPDHWIEAEREARELTRLHPSLSESARGVLLLGRLLLARGRARECADAIENAYLRLTGTPEILEAHLVAAQAYLDLGESEAARASLRQLSSVRSPRTLPPALRREELFLRGHSEVALGAPDAAIDAFHELLADEGLDAAQRGRALVGLGEACLIGGRAVHAAAASRDAEPLRDALDVAWQRRATALAARVAFAFGEDEKGFVLLEEAARDPSAVEIRALLAEELLRNGRLQRAIEAASELLQSDDRPGDRARLVTIEATLDRARGNDGLVDVLDAAVQLADEVTDDRLRERAARAILDAAFDAGSSPALRSVASGPQADLTTGLEWIEEAEELDRAGHPGAAAERRTAARARLLDARGALEPLASDPDAPLDGLFALARCEEALGRVDAARVLWEEIVLRDFGVTGDEESAGPWGRAAGTALAVRRWLEETGDWTPSTDVDTIRWQQR